MLFPDLRELIALKNGLERKSLQARASNATSGDYTSLFHGLGVEFETVRPYVVGDDVRHIDWRVTARIGKPQVKTFRAECDRNVLIIVDANAYMRFGTRETFKSVQAAKAAALLAWKSLQQQDRVGGFIFGDINNGMQYFKPSKTQSTVLRMLKLLCEPKINQHAPVTIASALRYAAKIVLPQSLVFILSDFGHENLDEIQGALANLRKKCTLVLLPVYDPADSDILPVGTLSLASDEKNCTINTNDALARQKYKLSWQTYATQLEQLSKKLKAPLIWIKTIMDPRRSLFAMTRMQAWKI